MFHFLLACLAGVLATPSAWSDDDPPLQLTVVMPDGKPAAGAKAWLYGDTDRKEAAKEPAPFTTDAAGKLRVPRVTDDSCPHQLYFRDSAGRIGHSYIYAPRGPGHADVDEIKVALIDTTTRKGRILAADGKPVAGAVVTPLHYYIANEPRGEEPGGHAIAIYLPEWERSRLATKTDAAGRFALVAPAGSTVRYSVKADSVSEMKWYASPGVELETKLIATGKLTITVAGVDSAALKRCEWHLSPKDGQPDKGVHPVRWQIEPFDGSAKVTVDAFPGRYEFDVLNYGRAPGVFEKGEPFAIESGKETTITAKFGPAATVSGKVVDKTTGRGIAGVHVNVNLHDSGGEDARNRASYSVKTDQGGNFTAHGPGGYYSLWVEQLPAGYAEPAEQARRGRSPPEKVEVGKSHAFAAIELPKTISFTGRVVFPDGKPAAGAVINIGSPAHQNNNKVTTDQDGQFAIKNLPPDDAVAPRVRLGKAVNVIETFELEKVTRPVTIEISEANGVGFKGQVTDAKGKPVVGAKVVLRQMIWGVGRNAGTGSYAGPARATTDAEGRYTFEGTWSNDQYTAYVTADGYAPGESKRLKGNAGEVQEFAVVKLTRTNLSVVGTVVGSDGKPVAGAEVFGVDGPKRFSKVSAADGSFTLTGYYDRAAFAFAKKAGYRLAAVPVMPGAAERVMVTLIKIDEPTAQPEITAAHRTALDKFTRHALTLVWETHPTFGYGGNALESMARIDLATARKWREEEMTRTNGKTDFNRLINRATLKKTLFGIAKDDIDEALAVLQGMKAADGFYEAMELGERMLPLDKAKAARFAEEAVVKARQREIPAKIYALAEAGNLAARAGNAAGGKKVMLEAAELAGKLTLEVNSQNTLAVGLVAANLAPFDWPKAESLLGLLKDASEYNRFLSATAARLATIDFAKAKQLLDQFKPSNSFYPSTARLRVAYAIAKEKPNEAVALVDGVKEGPYRCQGYVQLATIFAPTDKPRANKLIDTAFDFMDRDPEAFRSWSNFGGRAGVAAVSAVRAKEIGYPDVAGLVARTLAMRSVGQDDWSPGDRENIMVSLASALALADPASARHLLASIAPPDEFVEKALSQRREWLFALALADPERAMTLADKLIERARTARGGRNALSETGLVELGSILTADDRLKTLAMYGHLAREIDDRD